MLNLQNRSFPLPHISLIGVYPAVILPSVPSIPRCAIVRHARHCTSCSHRAIVHGSGASVVSVPAVSVPKFSAWRWWRLSSADRFKVFVVAIKAGAFSVRSRPTLLHLRLAVKPVSSWNTKRTKMQFTESAIKAFFGVHKLFQQMASTS